MANFMDEAIKEAESNLITNVGGPFGACIVKDGKIIGRGSNHVLANNDPTAHAEVTAIREACKNMGTYDLTGCKIYTNCYPCPMCLSAIIWSNIKKVYYGNTKEDAAKIGFRDDYIYNYINELAKNNIDKNVLDMENIDRDKTIVTFNKFDNKEDKTIY